MTCKSNYNEGRIFATLLKDWEKYSRKSTDMIELFDTALPTFSHDDEVIEFFEGVLAELKRSPLLIEKVTIGLQQTIAEAVWEEFKKQIAWNTNLLSQN